MQLTTQVVVNLRNVWPELTQGEDGEGVGPGEGSCGAGHAGADIDALGEQSRRSGGAAQVAHQPQGCAPVAEPGEAPGSPRGWSCPGILAGPTLRRDDAEAAAAPRQPQSVRRTSGKRSGRGNGRTAHAADESSPEPGSPACPPGPACWRRAAGCAPRWLRTRSHSRDGPLRRSPGSRPGFANLTVALVPAGRWPARLLSPIPERRPGLHGPRLACRFAEPRGGVKIQSQQEANYPPRLGPISGRGEGDRHRACVAGPHVCPAVPGPGGNRARPAVGKRSQHQQRAPVHPPGPFRRPGVERPGACQPAPVGAGLADPPHHHDLLVAEPSDRAQRVGTGQISLLDRVGPPERQRSPSRSRARATSASPAAAVPASCRFAVTATSGRPAGPGTRRSTTSP